MPIKNKAFNEGNRESPYIMEKEQMHKAEIR